MWLDSFFRSIHVDMVLSGEKAQLSLKPFKWGWFFVPIFYCYFLERWIFRDSIRTKFVLKKGAWKRNTLISWSGWLFGFQLTNRGRRLVDWRGNNVDVEKNKPILLYPDPMNRKTPSFRFSAYFLPNAFKHWWSTGIILFPFVFSTFVVSYIIWRVSKIELRVSFIRN